MKVGHGIFIPWSFKDKNGNLTGFAIEIVTQLAKDMGVEVEFIPTKWDGIIPALLTKKFDFVTSMGINTKRLLKVNFTTPVYHSGQYLAANKEIAAGYDSIEDFNNPDIIFAVKMGSTPAMTAKRLCPKAQFREFDSDAARLQEVLNGNAHVAMAPGPRPQLWVADHPDSLYLPLKDQIPTGAVAWAFRKGDFDTINFMNSWINDRISDGFIQARYDYWLAGSDWKDILQ